MEETVVLLPLVLLPFPLLLLLLPLLDSTSRLAKFGLEREFAVIEDPRTERFGLE